MPPAIAKPLGALPSMGERAAVAAAPVAPREPRSSAAAVDPRRRLARDADRVRRALARPARRPDGWTESRFLRDVERVRLHLRVIRSRAALVACFGHEAFNVAGASASASAPDDVSATRVAYAIRWLELGDGTAQPPLDELVAR